MSSSNRTESTRFLCVTLTAALTISFSGYWLLNYYVFPLCDELFIWTREVSAVTGGATLAALAITAAWRPLSFSSNSIIIAMVGIVLVGNMLLIFGLLFSLLVALLVGIWLSTIGFGLVSIAIGIACISLEPRSAGVCISLAYLGSYALRLISPFLSIPLGVLGYLILPLVAVMLSLPALRSMLNDISHQEAPMLTAVSNPSTFLPFSSQVFICLVLFRFSYGFSLAFGETAGETGRLPQFSALVLIPLAVFTLFLWVRRELINLDRVFPLVLLFIIIGFLSMSLDFPNSSQITGLLLMSGVGLFEVFILIVLVALGTRNRAIAVVIFTWAYSLNSLSTLVGANVGRLTNSYIGGDPAILATIGNGVVLLFLVYILLVLKNFNFWQTVEGISAVKDLVASADTSHLATQCELLGERYELTSREREVFLLLARGRNSPAIQKELHISYNTAKAHVRHIYTKLDVHSQQELIDLVEVRN